MTDAWRSGQRVPTPGVGDRSDERTGARCDHPVGVPGRRSAPTGRKASMLNYTQAIVIGLIQGVTELFPISSLGHSVLVPAWVGDQSAPESPYLAFIVGLHVATALALLWFFRADWVRVLAGLGRSVRERRIPDSDARLGWLLVIGTIPVGLTGLVFEHPLRTLFAKPLAAAVFLTINGGIL